jgi:hypothetical protein
VLKKKRQNDGRPPDTVKELLQKSPSKKKQKQVAKLKDHLAISTPDSENLKVLVPDTSESEVRKAAIRKLEGPGPASHPSVI